MGRLELPASCSQSKRATNCATPGYGIFQLWSNMWSTPIFDQLPARGKVLSAQVSQGFPGFPRTSARTRASRSQIKRDTTFATPGYLILFPYGSGMGQGRLTHIMTHTILTSFSTFSRGKIEKCDLFKEIKNETVAYSVLPKQARYQLRYTRSTAHPLRMRQNL